MLMMMMMMCGLSAGEIVMKDGQLFEHHWTLWQVASDLENKKGFFCNNTEAALENSGIKGYVSEIKTDTERPPTN